MEGIELSRLCEKSIKIVKEVGLFLSEQKGKVSRSQIEEKSMNSLVSYVDKTAEGMLVKGLKEILASSVFLTEEETVEQKTGKYRWIIDPLDGTTNFLHKVPCFSISVALEIDGELSLGIVYEVNHDECFSAWKNGGAYLNGNRIEVTSTSKIGDSLIATGFPYQDFSREQEYFTAFNYFMKNTRGIRRFGSAAVDLAYVACGRFDAYFEYGLNAWDVAAGILLVEEAGGKVCDFSNGPNCLFGKELIAVNNNLQADFIQKIQESFS